ncbi:hypothetical protein BP5796_02283 [Coleophoma crateriformis]|uniref:GED domain-containing protein n=1 Tax=Coleophoma crateriformis TaxID=565419 RepID=A0A3D8SZC6_9HELO|nr:hypothetical protein BP5796_02283 [Coleophoma crateriformis]
MSLYSREYDHGSDGVSVAENEDFEDQEGEPYFAQNLNSSNLLLTDDPFSNAMNRELFEAIDKLRRVGANQDIALPQLVIVGKQSSGKSSLLQSLTGIPFPTGGKLCTRFATRIVSRRDPSLEDITVTASLETGDVDPFKYPWDSSVPDSFPPRVLTTFTNESFQDAMNEASKAMGIKEDGPNQQHFSSKVFKIEIAGPQQFQFGILDIPGTFSVPTSQVSVAEMEGVKKMVASYMKQKENIIVCVVEADGDLAHQDIFTLAAEHVSERNLISVFTKCDRAQIPEIIVQSVNNKESVHDMQLYHGWHVVRNLAPQDPEGTDRELEEHKLFSQSPWSEIPANRRGATMLKRYLSDLLCKRIAEAFPGMLATIEKLKNTERSRLDRLGDPRPSVNDQRAYLMSIVHKYQVVASQALRSPADLELDDIKLRGKVQRANEDFAKQLRKNGKTYPFLEIDLPPPTPVSTTFKQSTKREPPMIKVRAVSESESEEEGNNPKHYGSARNGMFGVVSSEIIPTKKKPRNKPSPQATSPAAKSLYGEIRAQMETNRGEELPGFPNAAVVKPLMRLQSKKWYSIADAYFESVASLAENTSRNVLKQICHKYAPGVTRDKLEQVILDKYHTSKTNNPQYMEKIQMAQMSRFRVALSNYRSKCLPQEFPNIGPSTALEHMILVNDATITKLHEEIHSSQQKNMEDMIHDILKAYYEVAQEDFILHVTEHVVEPFLADEEGPIFGLSTAYIGSLSDEQIEDLGKEEDSVVDDRKRAKEKIARLEAAEKIAKETVRKTKTTEVSEP